ncbi:MAG: PQQ-like beta-propeller repeat protein, partial [Planctomycetes bacterium]|nr:PQQ-like beta-propeller repeat protein [Planctomycetota bacterium]
MVALNKTTGETVWKTDRSIDYSKVPVHQRKAYGMPPLIPRGNTTQLVGVGGRGVFSYDPLTGKELWKARHRGWSIAPRPVFGSGLLFAIIDRASPELWAIRPDGSGDVTDTHVVWRETKRMPARATPLLVEDLLFLVNRNGIASCLEAKSGKLIWQTELFPKARSSRRHQKNSHASPTPLVDDGRLYVHFGTNGTACLDLAGKILWKNEKLVYNPVHGGGSSPVRAGEVIVFSCDGAADPFVVGLDRKSGKIRWKTKRPKSSGKLFAFATALALSLDGKTQVILPGANWIASYDPANGKEIWRAWHGGYSVVPRPLYGHGLVYFSSSFDQSKLFAIRPDGKGEVTKTHIAWQSSKSAPHSATPVLLGEELYCVSDRGIASCIEARTGKLLWR